MKIHFVMSVFEDGKTVCIPLCLQHHVSLSALGNKKDARHLHLLICLCFLWTCRFLKHFDKNRNIISVCWGVFEFHFPSAQERTKREDCERYFMVMSVSVLWKESFETNRESEPSLGYRLIFMFVLICVRWLGQSLFIL